MTEHCEAYKDQLRRQDAISERMQNLVEFELKGLSFWPIKVFYCPETEGFATTPFGAATGANDLVGVAKQLIEQDRARSKSRKL